MATTEKPSAGSGGLMKRGLAGAAVVAALALGLNTQTQRIVRNSMLPEVPEAVPAVYAPCSDKELVDVRGPNPSVLAASISCRT